MLEPRQRLLPLSDSRLATTVPGLTGDERRALCRSYRRKLVPNPELNRALVSFQRNRSAPFYRWLKYKEAFSCEFVKYVLAQFPVQTGAQRSVLDPFAGVGTTLIAAAEEGWNATGIELLPVGIAAMNARLKGHVVSLPRFKRSLAALKDVALRSSGQSGYSFPHLKITQGAFPPETEEQLSIYNDLLEKISDENVHCLFRFALLAVLEEVSFTRKDGQYLRWDPRSGKGKPSRFNKGPIATFWPTVIRKLEAILEDIEQRDSRAFSPNMRIIQDSCLAELPRLPAGSFDLVVTSPPYCNRYDYTRTYALELAYLGYSEKQVKDLRQVLLSATVENKPKREQLAGIYASLGRAAAFNVMVECFENQSALIEVLDLLRDARNAGKLNNNNVPRMIEHYFFEMNLVVHELARLLRVGGRVVMVNDNVQYFGEEVPVDLILSEFAVHAGLKVENIWVLPRGKGNSSQQMGVHGRNEIRKCVYVWSK